MVMYALPAFFSSEDGTSVKPKEVMYKLPSYHDAAAGSSNVATEDDNEDLHLFDPVKFIESKQLALISRLEQLGDRLNTLVAVSGKAKSQNHKTTTVIGKETDNKPVQPEGKNKKDVKKEAKKEARKENKAKALVSNSGSGEKGVSTVTVVGEQWTVKEEKHSAETGQSLTAVAPQSLSVFDAVSIGPVDLTVTQDDLPWVENLSKVGAKRGISFEGKVKNAANGAQSSVTVSLSGGVALKSNNGSGKVSGRIAVWKALGSILGLSSFAATEAVHSAHSHQWLMQADAILSNSQFKETLSREACQFLSSRDSLGGHFSVCLADVVVYSLIGSLPNAPSNVELWAGRVGAALL